MLAFVNEFNFLERAEVEAFHITDNGPALSIFTVPNLGKYVYPVYRQVTRWWLIMKTKLSIALVLLLLVVIFIVQNTVVVDIRLFFWTVSMSRSLMIFIVLAAGIVIGWFMAGHFYRKRRQTVIEP